MKYSTISDQTLAHISSNTHLIVLRSVIILTYNITLTYTSLYTHNEIISLGNVF